MDKFFTGAVVGFLVYWLINQHSSNKNGGIHFLQDNPLLRPGVRQDATTVSGLISHNRVA